MYTKLKTVDHFGSFKAIHRLLQSLVMKATGKI
jgi:hypothetical protein